MIDQTRSHKNNGEHGRIIFLNVLRTMPPALQLETVRTLILDLMDVHEQTEFEEYFIRAHEALKPKE